MTRKYDNELLLVIHYLVKKKYSLVNEGAIGFIYFRNLIIIPV